MAESKVLEIYECQVYNRAKKWHAYEEKPYCYRDFDQDQCEIPYNISLPGAEWSWVGEWEVLKRAGITDDEGWEYASKMKRFDEPKRAPRTDPAFSSFARRRIWSRIMKREVGLKAADIDKILQRTRTGLASIHTARVRIEEIMTQAPDAAASPQMNSLVNSVKKNIHDVITRLDQISAIQQKEAATQGTQGAKTKQPNNSSAIVKKLRNDVLKEEVAINKALKQEDTSAATAAGGPGGLARASSASVASGRGSFVPPSSSSSTSSSSSSSGATAAAGSKSSLHRRQQRTISAELKEDLRSVDDTFASSSGTQGGVKTGAKGAFDPSVLRPSRNTNSDLGSDGEPAAGVFVNRSQQELQILEKFIPIDQATVMEEIIDERNVEIHKINKGVREVNEMFKDLARLVEEQDEEIQSIFLNCDMSNARTKAGLEQIVQAEHLQRTGQCVVS